MGPTELIRRVYAVQMLIDGEEKKQSEIMDQLNYIADFKIFAKNFPNARIKSEKTLININNSITPAKVSNLGKTLEQDGIIKIIPKRGEGRGGAANYWKIIKKENVLNKILQETQESIFDINDSLTFSSNIIYSEFGKSIIVPEMVQFLNEDYNIGFSEDELNNILCIIKMSPKALLYLFKLKNVEKFKDFTYDLFPDHPGAPGFVMYNFLIKLGEDINSEAFRSPFIFEYNIEINFKPENFMCKFLREEKEFISSQGSPIIHAIPIDLDTKKNNMVVKKFPIIEMNRKRIQIFNYSPVKKPSD